MESVEETKPAARESAPNNERSTVEFPYTDLDSALEVVGGVHKAGGTACDSDQLAAELNLEAKGGGFRMRIAGAKTFGLITYERGGRITLTELGRQVIDPQRDRQARADAFLAVELYQKVFDQFKGGPLPPQAGLDRALVTLGVGAGVKEKARQVLMRSAKQAGFLDYASDRLVKPAIKQEHQGAQHPAEEKGEHPHRKHGGGAGGGDGGEGRHPLVQGLLLTLPKPGEAWDAQERLNWLVMANSIFKMIYDGGDGPQEIKITLERGEQSRSSA